jgi:hypothetical protein
MELAQKVLNLYEMATIFRDPKFIIRVHTEPLAQKSFHLIKPNLYEVVLTIPDLKVLEVKFDSQKRKRMTFKLNAKELKTLRTIFKSKPPNSPTTVWISILDQWNKLNPKYPVDIKTEFSS